MTVALHLWNVVATRLWLLFLSSRLRYIADKQSAGELALFFFAGSAGIFVTMILRGIYPLAWFVPFVHDNVLFYHALVTGVVEEAAKFLCFIAVAHSLNTVKEPQDGVIQGAVVGLAFATLENILYIEQYRSLFMLIRPILATGGHVVYGAIWGGFYSAALYSNIHSKDPASYRLAVGGVALVALIHGLYNASLSLSFYLGVLIDLVALMISIKIFLRLVDHSPYRLFPLEKASEAAESIRKGLYLNPKSAILNRNMGLYLMCIGRYRAAAAHLSKAVPRLYDPRRARFFAAVCELPHVPQPHALRRLRITWSQLSDDQRRKLLRQLEQLLERDQELIQRIYDFIDSAFKPRPWKPAHELARELRLRKAERRSKARGGSPIYEELVTSLTREERRRMVTRVASRTSSYR